jgi:hypothetical protein
VPDFTVSQRGTDSSGRGIYATTYMWEWWQAICRELGFTPVVTQGAWMARNGGGASASAGYHDAGGCFDLRVWNLTRSQVEQTIRTLRANGAAAWLRDSRHGGFTDPHIHLVLGTDDDLAPGAAYQWLNYLSGGDGMGGRDYHPRPHPLVETPPESLMEDDMKPEDFDRIRAIVHEEIANAGETILIANPLDDGKKPKWKLSAILGRTFKEASK